MSSGWAKWGLAGAAGLALFSAWIHGPARIERTYFLMGTSLEMTVQGSSRAQALAAAELAFESSREAERRLSSWQADSELSRINASPVGFAVAVSALMERDLTNAGQFARELDFAFDPWIGPLVEAWGLKRGGKIPSADEQRLARAASAPGAFTLQNHAVIRKWARAAIEDGGFGKGVALDDAIAQLKAADIHSAVLNFGGQLSILGSEHISVAVANPADRAETLVSFDATAGSIATSGNSEHGVFVKSRGGLVPVGHLLDPRTGSPAPFEGSATIVASSGVEADCLSKVFVLGVEAGMRWANAHHVQLLWVSPSAAHGRWVARASCAWQAPLRATAPEVEIQSDCQSHS